MPTADDPRWAASDLDADDIATIRRAMESLADAPGAASAGESAAIPRFRDLESWVNRFFVLTFGRTGDGVYWCPQWWDHAEAVLRLDALWRTWEVAALDPVGGMAVWLRDHLDPSLAVLVGADGPFAACRDGNHVTTVFPVRPTPPGLWSGPRPWWDRLGEADR